MRQHVFVFSPFLLFSALVVSCSQVNTTAVPSGFGLTVVNVGQGLSQIGLAGPDAIVWDMGDSSGAGEWMKAYNRLGTPSIQSIVISHTHADHMDGLLLLPVIARFSGTIITSVFEDTVLLRDHCGSSHQQIRFRTIGRGDTIGGLDGVSIECVWPPGSIDDTIPIPDIDKNRYSLCFIVKWGGTSVFISSDIDTFAERQLSGMYGFSLHSDIIVVPHHGSSGSVDPVFYGYVDPSVAIISCGRNNVYGFPASNCLAMLFQMRLALYETDRQGTVYASSNGYYWTFACDTGL